MIVEFIWHYFSIHPRDKETIASRLALAGRAVAYGQDVDFQGPFPTSFSLSGNSLTIEYDDDLEVKNNEGFEVISFYTCYLVCATYRCFNYCYRMKYLSWTFTLNDNVNCLKPIVKKTHIKFFFIFKKYLYYV